MEAKGSILITGASSGIGRSCAMRMDRRGFRVFAGVRRPQDADALRAAGSELLAPLELDVTDKECIQRALARVGEAVGGEGLQGLVNNAGVGIGGPLELLPLEEVRRQFEVNVFGLLAVTQAFLPLIRMGRGRVVNIGSVSGRVTLPFVGVYAASKHALEALSDALRQELRPWGIRVCVIEPGMVRTGIHEKALAVEPALREKVPAALLELYGRSIAIIKEAIAQGGQQGLPPERVADKVEHALTAPRPSTRYLVGTDARVAVLLRWLLPDWALDWVVRQFTHLP